MQCVFRCASAALTIAARTPGSALATPALRRAGRIPIAALSPTLARPAAISFSSTLRAFVRMFPSTALPRKRVFGWNERPASSPGAAAAPSSSAVSSSSSSSAATAGRCPAFAEMACSRCARTRATAGSECESCGRRNAPQGREALSALEQKPQLFNRNLSESSDERRKRSLNRTRHAVLSVRRAASGGSVWRERGHLPPAPPPPSAAQPPRLLHRESRCPPQQRPRARRPLLRPARPQTWGPEQPPFQQQLRRQPSLPPARTSERLASLAEGSAEPSFMQMATTSRRVNYGYSRKLMRPPRSPVQSPELPAPQHHRQSPPAREVVHCRGRQAGRARPASRRHTAVERQRSKSARVLRGSHRNLTQLAIPLSSATMSGLRISSCA